MDYSPKLQRQGSCGCPTVDVVIGGVWCSSRRRRMAGFRRTFAANDDEYSEGYYDDNDNDDDDDLDPLGGYYQPSSSARSSSSGRRAVLRGIWRRIMKEKRRVLCPPQRPPHVPYDAYTYAQNFDEGAAWGEPENLSRSFSARFAVPSRVLRRLG